MNSQPKLVVFNCFILLQLLVSSKTQTVLSFLLIRMNYISVDVGFHFVFFKRDLSNKKFTKSLYNYEADWFLPSLCHLLCMRLWVHVQLTAPRSAFSANAGQTNSSANTVLPIPKNSKTRSVKANFQSSHHTVNTYRFNTEISFS